MQTIVKTPEGQAGLCAFDGAWEASVRYGDMALRAAAAGNEREAARLARLATLFLQEAIAFDGRRHAR